MACYCLIFSLMSLESIEVTFQLVAGQEEASPMGVARLRL